MAKTNKDESNINWVTPSKAMTLIEHSIAHDIPAALHGEPGVGKSAMMAQLAARLGYQYLDVRLVERDPSDLAGYQIVDEAARKTIQTEPSIMRTTGKWLINWEELNRAEKFKQNCALSGIQERRLGGFQFGPEVRHVASLNFGHNSGTVPLSSAMKNRFRHFYIKADLDDWCQWAYTAGINPMLIAFLRFAERDAKCGSMLHRPDESADAYPTPRSWEKVSKTVDDLLNKTIDPELAGICFQGDVGRGAAIELEAFVAWLGKINIDNILLNPDTSEVPSDPAGRYAVSAALSRRAEPGNFAVIMRYFERMQPEYAVMGVSAATARDKTLCQVPEFSKWFLKHKHLIA